MLLGNPLPMSTIYIAEISLKAYALKEPVRNGTKKELLNIS